MEDMEKMNVEAYVIHTHTHIHQNSRSDGSSVSIRSIVQAA